MTAARSYKSYRQREQIRALSLSLAMNQARAQNAQEKARRRSAVVAARLAALEPLLAKAGYGPHGGAERIRAEARALSAARSAGSIEHTPGGGCRVCAEGRRMAARDKGREITR